MLNKKIVRSLGWLLPILLMAPAVAWIALDKSPIGGDPGGYGVRTLALFHIATGPPPQWWTFISPENWGGLSLAHYEGTPPGIVWFGLIFVPLGRWLGGVDQGLLASILVTQCLALVLLFRVFWELSEGSLSVAILGILVVASAPLFVGLSHYYFTEPMQLLATAWFLLIMVHAGRWGRALTIAQLLGAMTLALLAKGSSPLYFIVPGMIALRHAFMPQPAQQRPSAYSRALAVTLAIVVPLSLMCGIWYTQHYPSVIRHILEAAYSEDNAPWVRQDSFLNALGYWINSTQKSFFPSPIMQIVVLATCAGGGAWLLLGVGSRDRARSFSLAALLQICLVIAIFSLSSNRDDRYMLPLLPYFAMLLVQVLAKANRPALTYAAIAVFLLQFIHVQAQALGLVPRSPVPSVYLAPVNGDQQPGRVVQSIVDQTCTDSGSTFQNVLGFQGGPISPSAANYVVARDMTLGVSHSCEYVYMGFSYFGAPIDAAWQLTLSRNVRYVIIGDPEEYPPSPSAINQSLNAENLPLLIGRLEESGLFRLVGRLPEDQGILLFKRNRKP